MKFLKHIRSKSKVKDKDDGQARAYASQYSPHSGRDATARLPHAILQMIFAEVCPFTLDNTYDSSEESLVDYGCALCDLKDLAQCALTSRRWWNAAQDLLYEVLFQSTHVWLTLSLLYIGTEIFASSQCTTVSENIYLPTNESINPFLTATPTQPMLLEDDSYS